MRVLLKRNYGFTLAEILIGVVLTGILVLAVTSVDITSHSFLRAMREKVRVQDEVKIAMEHMLARIRQGVGNMSNPGVLNGGAMPAADNSRGFCIIDTTPQLSNSGLRILIKIDGLNGPIDGQFDPTDPNDGVVEYLYRGNPQYDIRYIEPTATTSITESIITGCNFSIGRTNNEVIVTITAREDPTRAASIENPETVLTSSIVLSGMSVN